MNIKNFLRRNTIYFLAASMLFGGAPACSLGSDSKEIRPKHAQVRVDSGFEWILYVNAERKIYGENLDIKKNLGLEELVFTDIDPKNIELTEWEIPLLARFVPLKDMIEKHTKRYSIHPLWATMFFQFESRLNPSDHNLYSNDFGLGQIKRNSEKLAKKLGTNPKNEYYSPNLREDGSIFDPETNIIMSMLLHRYNIDKFDLENSDQAYAIYVRGEPGLKSDGSLSKHTKDIVPSFRERYKSLERIIPLFMLSKDELSNVKNKDTRTILEVYHSNGSVKDMYAELLTYFLEDLEKNIDGNARSVLVYDDCVVFARTLDIAYVVDQTKNYRRLLGIGKKLSVLVTNKELKDRVNRTYSILTHIKL